MSTTPAVVTTAEPAAETLALSATRTALARARRSRNDADAALSEAVKAQKVAEQRAGTPDEIRARIAELERKTAGAVEHWAMAGGVGQPAFPYAEELDALRRQLAEAERTADAALLAMLSLNTTCHVRYTNPSESNRFMAVCWVERITVRTGRACRLTRLPELDIQCPGPTGPNLAVRPALRAAPQRQFETGLTATSLGSEGVFARDSASPISRGPAGETRRPIPPAQR
jgi:hypothetical protein